MGDRCRCANVRLYEGLKPGQYLILTGEVTNPQGVTRSEDFASAFMGIGKALATWTWNGQARGVFVTVAGAGGAAIASLRQIGCVRFCALPIDSQVPRRYRCQPNQAQTFDPKKHYSAVLMQQGRVQVDADWNEQQALESFRIETEAML